jgi:phage-related protein
MNILRHAVKPVRFLGDSLERLRAFPAGARHDVGYQIWRVQLGESAEDYRPMPTIGPGVEEIRVRDVTGAYRVVCTARLVDAVYVLHVFQKKSRATSRIDVEIAARRFKVLVRTRG